MLKMVIQVSIMGFSENQSVKGQIKNRRGLVFKRKVLPKRKRV